MVTHCGCDDPLTAMIRANGPLRGPASALAGSSPAGSGKGKTRTALQSLLHAAGSTAAPAELFRWT